jgi:hydrogenase maturation protease
MKPGEINGFPIVLDRHSFFPPHQFFNFSSYPRKNHTRSSKGFMNNAPQTALVIGYGNDLRSDDAVGKRVAEVVATWKLPHVQALAVHQLTPELTVKLTGVERAIFVDAYRAIHEQEVQVRPLEAGHRGGIAGHTGDPQSLLALTKALYSHCPQAWWVTIPGINFEVGDNLSLIAKRGVVVALERIDQLIGPPGPPYRRFSKSILGGEASLASPQLMDANAMNGLCPTKSPPFLRGARGDQVVAASSLWGLKRLCVNPTSQGDAPCMKSD